MEVWRIRRTPKRPALLFFSSAASVAPSMLWVSTPTCPSHLSCVLYCSLQVKLMKYICKQLQCKQKVPETERPEALDSYPRLRDWLRTINLRPELTEVGPAALCGCQCVLLRPGRLRSCHFYVYWVHAHAYMWNTWPVEKKQGWSCLWSNANSDNYCEVEVEVEVVVE